MKKMKVLLLLFGVIFLNSCAVDDDGCITSFDCTGDLVCLEGQCVQPTGTQDEIQDFFGTTSEDKDNIIIEKDNDTFDKDTVDNNPIDKDVVDKDIVDNDLEDNDILDRDVVDNDIKDDDILDKDMLDEDVAEIDSLDNDIVETENVSEADIFDEDFVENDIVDTDFVENDISENDSVDNDILDEDTTEIDALDEDILDEDNAADEDVEKNLPPLKIEIHQGAGVDANMVVEWKSTTGKNCDNWKGGKTCNWGNEGSINISGDNYGNRDPNWAIISLSKVSSGEYKAKIYSSGDPDDEYFPDVCEVDVIKIYVDGVLKRKINGPNDRCNTISGLFNDGPFCLYMPVKNNQEWDYANFKLKENDSCK